ncbi:NADH dehydrogenase I subunit J [Mycobacterium tuberculosis]|nr:NADH dehydrogenase I subunit J [Mycobacterium tuberculosis]
MTAVLASDVIVRTSTGEAVMFWVLSALALLGAVGLCWPSTPCTQRCFWR